MKSKKNAVLLIICFVLFILSAILAVYILSSLFFKPSTNDDISVPPTSSEILPTINSVIDFNEWQEKNEDIYAWIYIEGTNINYPILQSQTDKGYYLNHDYLGNTVNYGSIYTENYNTKTFKDFNTMIYGHNMYNGTMFTELMKYKERDFFDEYNEIYIFTPENAYKYKIFAAYINDKKHIMLANDFSNEQGFQAYIDKISEYTDGNFDDSVNLTIKDKIISLSTCTAPVSNGKHRYLVQAVLDTVYEYSY